MDAFTVYREGHIYPVVDQERNTIFSGHLMKFLCGSDEVTRIVCLVSVLHESDASAEGSVDDVTDILIAKNRGSRICD